MTKVQKWLTTVAAHGCVITGDKYNIQLHHILGRTAKRDKQPIGLWYVLPLHWSYHDVASNHPLNVTHHKKAFVDQFGSQKELFLEMCYDIKSYPPAEVLAAIQTMEW